MKDLTKKEIKRVCPKCNNFLKVISPIYFSKLKFKCTDLQCQGHYQFDRLFLCANCEFGKLELIGEGVSPYNNDFIYKCDLCNCTKVYDTEL